MGMTKTPLVCGHAFAAEVRPRFGERVWCHTCFDYRYVRSQHWATADPAPAKSKAKPEPAVIEHQPTPRPICSSGHERTPENTYKAPSTGRVRCRVCRIEGARRRRDRAKS